MTPARPHRGRLLIVLPLQGTGHFGIVTEGVALGYGVNRPFRPLEAGGTPAPQGCGAGLWPAQMFKHQSWVGDEALGILHPYKAPWKAAQEAPTLKGF